MASSWAGSLPGSQVRLRDAQQLGGQLELRGGLVGPAGGLGDIERVEAGRPQKKVDVAGSAADICRVHDELAHVVVLGIAAQGPVDAGQAAIQLVDTCLAAGTLVGQLLVGATLGIVELGLEPPRARPRSWLLLLHLALDRRDPVVLGDLDAPARPRRWSR